jgi:hypothetical protein
MLVSRGSLRFQKSSGLPALRLRLTVVERGARRIDHVAAAVVPPVLPHAEAARGARDHLPQARSAPV